MKHTTEMFDANKALWNKRTDIHIESEFYDNTSFKNGRNTLNSFELDILGNIDKKNILHLQCHFGQDTLSLARMGAHVTGLDFSENAIEKARLLSKEIKIDAKFVCCNVLEMDQHINDKFEIIFASYGICGWLPNLEHWAKLIADRITEGGKFVLVDFHPMVWMFDDDFKHIKYAYFNKETIELEEETTYTDKTSLVKMKSFGWNHSISEITSVLMDAGLTLKQFNEYDYSPYPCFDNLVEFEKRKYQIKGMEGKLPMVYGLEFTK